MKQNRDGVENSKRCTQKEYLQNYKILCLCPPYGRNIIIIFRCEFLWSWVTLSPNTKMFCSTAPFVSPGLSAGLPYISFHSSSPATTLTSPMVIVREVLQENKQISLFCRVFLAFYPSLLGTEYLSSTGDR